MIQSVALSCDFLIILSDDPGTYSMLRRANVGSIEGRLLSSLGASARIDVHEKSLVDVVLKCRWVCMQSVEGFW
jgi:hypothetical protein